MSSRKLLKYLDDAGITVVRTTSGYQAYCPGGGIVTWHNTSSDRRAAFSMRNDFRRNNVDVPLNILR